MNDGRDLTNIGPLVPESNPLEHRCTDHRFRYFYVLSLFITKPCLNIFNPLCSFHFIFFTLFAHFNYYNNIMLLNITNLQNLLSRRKVIKEKKQQKRKLLT